MPMHLASTRVKIQPHPDAPACTAIPHLYIYSTVQKSESTTDPFPPNISVSFISFLLKLQEK